MAVSSKLMVTCSQGHLQKDQSTARENSEVVPRNVTGTLFAEVRSGAKIWVSETTEDACAARWITRSPLHLILMSFVVLPENVIL